VALPLLVLLLLGLPFLVHCGSSTSPVAPPVWTEGSNEKSLKPLLPPAGCKQVSCDGDDSSPHKEQSSKTLQCARHAQVVDEKFDLFVTWGRCAVASWLRADQAIPASNDAGLPQAGSKTELHSMLHHEDMLCPPPLH
jgi:hypothetical protein